MSVISLNKRNRFPFGTAKYIQFRRRSSSFSRRALQVPRAEGGCWTSAVAARRSRARGAGSPRGDARELNVRVWIHTRIATGARRL